MKKFLIFMSLGILLLSFQNCGGEGGTILGNPFDEPVVTEKTTLKYSAYNENSNGLNQKVSSKTGLSPLAVDDGLEIYICLRRSIFYQYSSGVKQIFDIGLGEVELQSGGTKLGNYDLAQGLYKKVQLKLRGDENLCPNEFSVKVVNANGEFYTQSWFRVYYDDLRQRIDGPGQSLEIEINSIVDALRDVRSNQDIDDALIGSGIATYW